MRRLTNGVLLSLLLLSLLGCPPAVRVTPPPAGASAESVKIAGAAVIVAVGDIAACDSRGDEQTAALVDSILRADSAAKVEDVVVTMGDNAYPNGSERDFAVCWGSSWGDSTKLIMKRMRPSPGNHEHNTAGAAPYYRYFGERAGSPKRGYYSFDIGEWHVVALNSEIVVNSEFLTTDRKAQEDWLRADLRTNTKKCTIAFWHHPRFSTGFHGNEVRMMDLWKILYDSAVDLVLAGHDHEYERFGPMSPAGTRDTLKGIPSIVVGTGGGDLRGFRRRIEPNSEERIQGYFGVLKLTLGAGEYQRAFIDVAGRVWDSGGGKCK